jgi:hypothetical protein
MVAWKTATVFPRKTPSYSLFHSIPPEKSWNIAGEHWKPWRKY